MFYKDSISILKNFLAKIAQPELSKIHKLKGIHQGLDCYILGDGISIKWFDLNNFSNKISIALGLMPFHKSFRVLDMMYLALPEPYWFYPSAFTKHVTNSCTMPEISKAYRNIILENPEKKFILNLSNLPVLQSSNIVYVFREIFDQRLSSDFISHRIDAFDSSFRTAIVLAIYLGFKRIYLVGCDYTHVPSRKLHWYERGRGIFESQDGYQEDFLKIAKEFVDLTTITLDGTSDFINAVTYKEFTGHEPMYQENTELVDQKYLHLLSTFPGYQIY